MDERDRLPASNRNGTNFDISTIFLDRRPCCLVEGLLHSFYKEIIDNASMFMLNTYTNIK